MPEPTPIYLDPAYPREDRVRDLLSRLTLQEKISLMANEAGGIPRLGIPAFNYWSEALHGVARNGRATVFPQAIGLAATWDPALMRRIADAISDVTGADCPGITESRAGAGFGYSTGRNRQIF